jgi:hypothetical protein
VGGRAGAAGRARGRVRARPRRHAARAGGRAPGIAWPLRQGLRAARRRAAASINAFRARSLRFGGAALDAEDAALLSLCDGRTLGEATGGDAARLARARSLIARGRLVP